MSSSFRYGALPAIAGLLLTVSAPAVAAGPAGAGDPRAATLRGTARLAYPPAPDDKIIFSVDAHARYDEPANGPLPSSSWGTARLSHESAEGAVWYSISVDCLVTGGNTATVTGIVVHTSPNAEQILGARVGFSVADLGRHDRVGMTGAPVGDVPELRQCMAPATVFAVRDGDLAVVDADHW
jgi:hypothetical protein